MFDRADAIELIDLTPDDLIQRLKEGKVYVPKQAERALEHYFSPGNLTALRELALRRTAERVDEQLLTHMQANAIAGPWAAGERILVCVSEDPRAAGLVRYTKRLADRLHAPWTAISIETRRSLQLTDEQRDRLADTMRLAEALGGEALTIPGVGRRIADDVIDFAHANNVTQIIIGKSTRSWWFELTRGSVVHDLVRRAGNISVNVIAGDEAGPVAKPAVQTAARPEPFNPRPYVMALLFVAIGLAAGRADPAHVRWHRKRRSGVPDRGGRRRRALRPVAVDAGQRRGVAVLQFLLPAAGLYLHHHRSDQCRGVLLLHADRDSGFQRRGAGAHAGRYRDRPGAHHGIALRLQPQARGHRDAGRRAVGDRLPDRADAEGAGGAAVAGRRRVDGQGGLSAGGPARPGRSRRRQLGLGQRSPGRPRLGHAAGRQTAVPADADRARRDRRHRHRRRPDRAPC